MSDPAKPTADEALERIAAALRVRHGGESYQSWVDLVRAELDRLHARVAELEAVLLTDAETIERLHHRVAELEGDLAYIGRMDEVAAADEDQKP